MAAAAAAYHDHDDSTEITTFDTMIGDDYNKDDGKEDDGDDGDKDNDDNGRRRMITIIEQRQRCRDRKRCTVFVLMVYIVVAIYYWYCNSFLASR